MLTKLVPQAGQGVLEMLQVRYPQYHPLLAIADIAHSQQANQDIKLQFDCHKTIAEYVLPKLRAVEHSGEVNQQRRVIVQLFDEGIEDGQLVQEVAAQISGGAQEALLTELAETEELQVPEVIEGPKPSAKPFNFFEGQAAVDAMIEADLFD